jgi:hypothetical protein
MDDKERRHLDAAFLWLSRKHSGFAGGNPTSVIRILLSIEKDLRAIERAATVAPDYSRADFLRGFTKVFATKSRSRFPITKRGAAESKDDARMPGALSGRIKTPAYFLISVSVRYMDDCRKIHGISLSTSVDEK